MNFLHEYYRWRSRIAKNEQDKIDFRLKAYRHSKTYKTTLMGGRDITFDDFSKIDIENAMQVQEARYKKDHPGIAEFHRKAIKINPELKPRLFRLVPTGAKLKNGDREFELVEVKIELDYTKDNLHFMPANRAKPKTKK